LGAGDRRSNNTKNLLHIASEPVGGTAEQLECLFQQDYAKSGRLVKELGIKAAEN
jgi:hypothetical protein